jgi:hypothetical protein
MSLKYFNLDAIRPGDIICRDATGFMAALIRRACKASWAHDALVLGFDGELGIGDALFSGGSRVSEFEAWEASMDAGKFTSVVVLRAIGITPQQGIAASDYWLEHIKGRSYDWLALVHLGWSALWGRNEVAKAGVEAKFYCTESARRSCRDGGSYDPWAPKKSGETPGTTNKRVLQPEPTLAVVRGALTEAGMRFMVKGLDNAVSAT